jgi:ribosomal protein S1
MNKDQAWETIKQTIRVGTLVRGIVTYHAPFGIFVAIPDCSFEGLVLIANFKDSGTMTPDEYPPVGSPIEGVVLAFKDKGNQISLGMKPSQLIHAK